MFLDNFRDSHVSPDSVGHAAAHTWRRWMIWKDSRWVHALLLVLSLGQWGMLVFGTSPSSHWQSFSHAFFGQTRQLSVRWMKMESVRFPSSIRTRTLQSSYTVSPITASKTSVVFNRCIRVTCYDLLVFVLSVVGLSKRRSESPLKKHLRGQGILYLALVVMVYIPPTVWSPYSPFHTACSSSYFRLPLCSMFPVRLNYFG